MPEGYDILEPENEGYEIIEPEQSGGYDVLEPEVSPPTEQLSGIRGQSLFQPSQFGGGASVTQPGSDGDLLSAFQLPFDALGAGVSAVMEKVVEPIAHKIGEDVFINPPELGESIIPEEIMPYGQPGEKGVLPAATRMLRGMTTEGGLLTAPMAGLKPIQALYGAGAVGAIPQSVQNLAAAKTDSEAADAATELGMTLGIAGLTGAGLARPPRAIPRTTPHAEAMKPIPEPMRIPPEAPAKASNQAEIASELGLKPEGEMAGRWTFSKIDPKDGQPQTFAVKAGASKEAIAVRAKEVADSFEESKPLGETVAKTTTAEELSKQPSGSLTAETISIMPDSEIGKFFDKKNELGEQIFKPHREGVIYGIGKGPDSVAELNSIIKQASKDAGEAIRLGKSNADEIFKSNMAKMTWAAGAIEGALKKGPNYDKYVAEQAAQPRALNEKAQAPQGKEILTPEEQAGVQAELQEAPAGAVAQVQPLAPSPVASPTVLPPKSQRQIITDLAKGLNVPIRFGRLTTSKFAGYFKPRADLIGSKRAIDIPVVSHEAGHKLDSTLKLSSDPSIASELDVLGDPATPGSGSSWTKSKSRSYKMGEGMGEFVRHWLTDPAKALKDAPKTHAAFEAAMNANKDIGDVMRQAQDDIRVWREAEPQARLRSHISTSNPNKTRYTLSQLTRDIVDDLHILRLAVDDAKRTSDVPPSKDPYLAARNLRGSYGMAETFIRNGVADFNTKGVTLGTSLQDALKPVSGRLNDFRDWIVAKRAAELRGQGKETGLVPTDVDAVVAKFDSDPAFKKAFDDIKAWNDAALQYSVDAGLITPESAAAMRKMNQDYVPFHRLFEVGAGEAPSQQAGGIGAGLNVGKPGSLKRLTGSTREIVDPIETMIKNAYTIITASEKAAINRSVADMASLPGMGKWVEKVATPKEGIRVDLEGIKKQLEDAGADLTNVPDDLIMTFFRQSGRAPFGENIIRVIKDGKPEFYRLNRDLHDTFQALDLEDTGKLIRILSAPAQLLRAGVVLEPSFNVANALRDTFSSAVISRYGVLPFETTLKGVAAMIRNPQAVAEWAAAGGKNSVEANFFDRAKMQKFMTEHISKALTPSERVLIVVKSPLTALRWLTSKAEEATRIGEYQTAFKSLRESGMPEGEARRLAAFEARDRQDFAKGGAKTKIIRHMSAFWNAALQANVKLAETFKDRPVRTTLQGLAFITIPKLLEQAVNWDDEDYWNRQQWERDLFFLIPIGKDQTGHTRFLRIPTPFEPGIIFGTFPGRLLQWLKTNKPESVTGFPQLMLKQSVPNPIPQTLNVAFEDFLSGEKGWDIWRGRTIVPESLADLPPDLQWTEQTSALAKEVGKRLNFSPMKVDHIIERTTGGIGKIATGRQVPGQRFVAAPLNVSNQVINDFYETIDKLRKDRARVNATDQGTVPESLADFEKVARQLSALRNKARNTSVKSEKNAIQEEMYQLAKGWMDQYESSQ
jgi:hypothetical protein